MSLTYRPFALPPIGDGLLIGRRASVGPNALADAIDRMLPGMYELVRLDDHPVIEAAIVLRSHFRLVGRDRLVAAMVAHAEDLMDADGCLQVGIAGEVTVQAKIAGPA